MQVLCVSLFFLFIQQKSRIKIEREKKRDEMEFAVSGINLSGEGKERKQPQYCT